MGIDSIFILGRVTQEQEHTAEARHSHANTDGHHQLTCITPEQGNLPRIGLILQTGQLYLPLLYLLAPLMELAGTKQSIARSTGHGTTGQLVAEHRSHDVSMQLAPKTLQ
jgi:hypothetical protein